MEHIARGGEIIGSDSIGGAELASAKHRFDDGHVLFGKLRPNLGKVARPSFSGVCSTDILPIRPGANLDRDYLVHFLRQPSMVDYAATRTTGANLPRLSPATLATFKVPLPRIAEQRRIAAILDQADATRTKRRQILTHLDTLTQSTFHAMFGDAEDGQPLGEHLAFLTSGSRGWAKYYADSGSVFIRIQNVRGATLDRSDLAFVDAPDNAEARRTQVQPGDVLLSITADLGRTAVVPDDLGKAYISQHLAILRAPRLAPLFLAHYLESTRGRASLMHENRGQTKDGLNFENIRSVCVPDVPVERQAEFARRAHAIAAHRDEVVRALAVDDELFASLQARAFRGEL
nr:restriction endonuclease subunit S [Cellulomonas uda]